MRRVAVTGCGVVSSLGYIKKVFREAVFGGKCGIRPITAFDMPIRGVKLASEVSDFDPSGYFSPKKLRYDSRYTKFARYAAADARFDAFGESGAVPDPYRCGVILSSSAGGAEQTRLNSEILEQKGADRVLPYYMSSSLSDTAAANAAVDCGAHGCCFCINTACASGSNAIGEAYLKIRDGYMDTMLAGASEASLTPLTVGGFAAMRVLYEGDDVSRASIPFDAERSGFVMGEGAGVLVLEEMEQAEKRGAHIYAEIAGYSCNCDARDLTSPDPESVARLFEAALFSAGISEDKIDYINAHGTSTLINDSCESKAINAIFPSRPLVSSSKSMLGHLLGAAGAVEALITCMAIEDGRVPPNINYSYPDGECMINVADKPVVKNIEYALCDSLGFGGHNAALIFKKYHG